MCRTWTSAYVFLHILMCIKIDTFTHTQIKQFGVKKHNLNKLNFLAKLTGRSFEIFTFEIFNLTASFLISNSSLSFLVKFICSCNSESNS